MIFDRAALAVALAAGALAGCSDEPLADQPSTTTVIAAAEVTTVPLEGRPAAVAFARGVLWVADDETGVVRRLDPDDGQEVGPPIAVSAHPTAIAADDHLVWVVDADGTVTMIDPATAALHGAPMYPGGVLVSVALDGDRAWVGDIENGVVRAIDPATRDIGPPVTVPAGVVRLLVSGERLWVTGLQRSVTPIDRETLRVGDPIEVGAGPIGMAAADGVLWVANSDASSITVLDSRDGRRRGPDIAVGPAPIAIAIAVGGDDLWVLSQDGPTLTAVSRRGQTALAPIDLPHRPRGLATVPAGVWTVGVDPSSAVLLPVDHR